jgi:hypothetical protein
MVEATEADRKAAAPFAETLERDQQLVIAGKRDSNHVVQAFAAHRIAATSAKDKRIAELEAALQLMLDHYLSLANCGDCGFWDPEKEEEVIAARKALTP